MEIARNEQGSHQSEGWLPCPALEDGINCRVGPFQVWVSWFIYEGDSCLIYDKKKVNV